MNVFVVVLLIGTVGVQAGKFQVRQADSEASGDGEPTTTVAHSTSKIVTDPPSYSSCAPANCLEIKLKDPKSASGLYKIYPRRWFNVRPFDVYCDMETDGGGWIVIQRRGPYVIQENFDRNWTDYRNGFGDKSEDHWIGLQKIFLLTVQDQMSLRIDLQDKDGKKAHAIYRHVQLGDRDQNYPIYPSDCKGSAGDPFWVGTQFTTKDRYSVRPQCLTSLSGGWWFNDNCPPGEKMNNLNGVYDTQDPAGMNWKTWNADLARTEMKIRPSFFPNCANGGSHYYYS